MSDATEQKEQHLRKHSAFYTGADDVADPLFDQSEFFDPRDLVQVKYEGCNSPSAFWISCGRKGLGRC